MRKNTTSSISKFTRLAVDDCESANDIRNLCMTDFDFSRSQRVEKSWIKDKGRINATHIHIYTYSSKWLKHLQVDGIKREGGETNILTPDNLGAREMMISKININ